MLDSWAPSGARIAKEKRRLRIGAAALKAGVGLFALLWATLAIAATGAGTSSAMPGTSTVAPAADQVPSIEILNSQTGLAGTCGGAAFDVNTFINIGTQASADVRLNAPGVGIIEEFTDETGKNIGPYNAPYPTFHILSFGGGLAPDTPITLTVTTYSGPGLTGFAAFTSSATFDCTTGAVVLPQGPGGTTASIPALSTHGLLALTGLFALLGMATLRRGATGRGARDGRPVAVRSQRPAGPGLKAKTEVGDDAGEDRQP
jgi:hypothetical protein